MRCGAVRAPDDVPAGFECCGARLPERVGRLQWARGVQCAAGGGDAGAAKVLVIVSCELRATFALSRQMIVCADTRRQEVGTTGDHPCDPLCAEPFAVLMAFLSLSDIAGPMIRLQVRCRIAVLIAAAFSSAGWSLIRNGADCC